jgi:hypothetical protein
MGNIYFRQVLSFGLSTVTPIEINGTIREVISHATTLPSASHTTLSNPVDHRHLNGGNATQALGRSQSITIFVECSSRLEDFDKKAFYLEEAAFEGGSPAVIMVCSRRES